MSTQYNGIVNNTTGSLFSAVNIASSTNANPIVLATSTPHNLTTGDQVDIQNHLVNTHANGLAKATVLSPTTFSIARTGNGVGGATGTVQSLALGATYQIPSDGDSFSASAFNVAYTALGDRTAFLGYNTGQFKLAFAGSSIVSGQAFNTQWMSLTGPVSGLNPMTSAGLGIPSTLTIPGVIGNDIIECSLETSLFMNAAGSGNIHCMTGLALGFYAYGASAPLVTVFPQKVFSGVGSSVNNYTPLNLRTWAIAPASLASDASTGFQLYIAFYANTDGITETVAYTGDGLVTTKIYRNVLMPQ